MDYLEINKKAWNNKVDAHVASEFYQNESFIKGRNSLNQIELDLLGDVSGLRILHLQCHFGQDTISLSRMGAQATGIDLSDEAIDKGKELAEQCGTETQFVCSDVYSLPENLKGQFDLVFTSYGTIGWLPDLDRWAGVVDHFLAPKGRFLIVEFHPAIWMFDDDFNEVKYSYFNNGTIQEEEQGTYADKEAELSQEYISWNHDLAEVMSSLLEKGFNLKHFGEYDYSPYNCFNETEEFEPGKFRIKKWGNKLPMVYSILMEK